LCYYKAKGVLSMKKKLFIGLGILLLIVLSSAVTFAVSSGALKQQKLSKPSDYHIGVSYDKAMNGEKPVLALFYVDWCGYCLRFMPKFKTLESEYKNKYNLLMINAEDPTRADLVQSVRVAAYPTIYILDPKYDNRIHINSPFYGDLKAFGAELDRYLRIRQSLDKASSCQK